MRALILTATLMLVACVGSGLSSNSSSRERVLRITLSVYIQQPAR
jgi:hypothetical protein